ncbi:hypothetical protein LSAT2_016029 [Lamellibrachia satsuma]|nr:hypothetical protein LSAT2_016029 [Lamellibrachia satsuma]
MVATKGGMGQYVAKGSDAIDGVTKAETMDAPRQRRKYSEPCHQCWTTTSQSCAGRRPSPSHGVTRLDAFCSVDTSDMNLKMRPVVVLGDIVEKIRPGSYTS